MKKTAKKLTLNRETVLNLQSVTGGRIAPGGGVDSDGPDICWISDCNPCETTVYADPLPVALAPQPIAADPVK